MHEILRPLRIRGFARLAATYALNELADWLATITLAILVYDATGEPLAATALFVAAKFLPALAVPVVAARLDNRPVARVLSRAYLAETAIFAALALTADAFWLPLVLLLALLDGTVAASARAITRAATVAVLEPAGRLREGNALLNVAFATMYAGGPALAALLVAASGPGPVLGLAGGVFLVLAVVVSRGRDLPAGRPDRGPTLVALREGLAYARRNPAVRTLLSGQALVILLFTMVTPIEVVYAKESLDAGDAGLGLLLTAAGAGVLVGSAVFARARRAPLALLVALPTAVMALGYVGLALAPSLPVAMIVAMVTGVGNGVQWIAVVTAIQESTEERFQGRIAGLLEAVGTGAPGIAYVLGGAITAVFDPRTAFAVGGAGVLVVLAVGGTLLRGSRERRGAPIPAPTPAPAGDPVG
ncbi:MAG TPA: MFS transporter [Solirubrobacteraceae bacterium]|nr:MFS transporter [Solirubrobacteraceae bacterium]